MPRRNSKALTDPGIGKIGRAPKGNRSERFDALAPGLCLRVTDNGTKSWSVYYRLDGKHKRMTIGGWLVITSRITPPPVAVTTPMNTATMNGTPKRSAM